MKKIKQSQRQTGCYQEYKYMYNGESQKKTETAKRIFKEVIPEERMKYIYIDSDILAK